MSIKYSTPNINFKKRWSKTKTNYASLR